jgi:acyl-CoA hydrolase
MARRMQSQPQVFLDYDACVDATIARVGKRIVLGLPVGIGKPNELVNAFVKRAVDDSTVHLTLFTALSLRAPRWKNDLERRFLQPFVERVFGNYQELEYVRLLERSAVPANIEINEFFLEPGAWLRNPHVQQNYLSSNYTHVARDLIARGVNVIAQLFAVSKSDATRVSLSCNPDLTVDLLPHIESLRSQNKPFALIGHACADLPYMYGDADVERKIFDFVIDKSAATPLFCPPNMPIGTTDYMIALNVSALVKDGGTLQLGIGELGDAIVYGLKLRQEQPDVFASILKANGLSKSHAALLAKFGGIEPLTRGLYGCSEMFVDGFVDLYRCGVLKRRVYPHGLLQRLLDEGCITESVDAAMLQKLAERGLEFINAEDFAALQSAGVFADHIRYANGNLLFANRSFSAHIGNAEHREAVASACLGSRLRNGVLMHGGFFFGPQAFYAALRDMHDEERRQFAMQRISFVNELYGHDQELRIAHRRHARFINTTMMVTGLGAAVSDGLAEGRVVSGVGGQYNFVAMAHALPDARSILCVRSTRTTQGRTESNIVWNYGHATIPRHLRDIVVTEYGVADLRSRTDSEVVAALVAVMDARFQDAFVAQAKRNGKVAGTYSVPDRARLNTPQSLEKVLQPYRERGLFGALPFGSDFTDDEIVIAKALKRLQADTATRKDKIRVILKSLLGLVHSNDQHVERMLARLALEKSGSLAHRLQRSAIANALRDTLN